MAKFSEVLSIINGRNQKAVENPNGKYPIYGSGGIMGYADDYICNANTVIIGRKGSINNPIYVTTPFWNVDTAFGLEANNELLLPKYLYYFCLNYDFEKLNTTVTIPSLTKQNLLKIDIPLPDIETQRKIAANLDKVTHTIDLCNAILEKLDLLVKSRFVEMFGEPVTNSMKHPKHTLIEICNKITDGTHDTPKRYDSGYLLITGKNIRANEIILDQIEYVNEEDHKTIYARCNPEYEDILYTNIGVNYGTAVLNTLKYEFSMKNVALLKPNRTIVNSYYLWKVLNYMRDYILELNQVGGAQTFMGLATIKKISIPVPPLELQNQFAAFVEQTDKSKLAVKQVLEKAETLKKALMQEYFG